MILTLWLPLANRPTERELRADDMWVKQVDTGNVPTVADRVVLWPTGEGDPAFGPSWPVHRRRMAADGGWHVNLSLMAVDPTDLALYRVQNYRAGGLGAGPEWTVWSAEIAGDPVPLLRAGGWKLYGETGDADA